MRGKTESKDNKRLKPDKFIRFGMARRCEFSGDEPLGKTCCSILLQADADYNRYASVAFTDDFDEVDLCMMLGELQDCLLDALEDEAEDLEAGLDDEDEDCVDEEVDMIIDRLLNDEEFRWKVQLLMATGHYCVEDDK